MTLDEATQRFNERKENFSQYGELPAFALAAVCGSMDVVNSINREEGARVVATRDGNYRSWDPETIRVDEATEGYFFGRLRERTNPTIVLSEEAGRVVLPEGASEDKADVYAVSDPFDGSLLFKYDIPAFQFTTLAFYDRGGTAICAAVCDINNRRVYFNDSKRAYEGNFENNSLVNVREIKPDREVTDLKDAVLESYMMKPHRMYPFSQVYKSLFESARFILPNGGPAGFADVAKGSVHSYLALNESHIEVFSGLPIALKAGAVVTTETGEPVNFEDDINRIYHVVCSANQEMHEKVLEKLMERNRQNE